MVDNNSSDSSLANLPALNNLQIIRSDSNLGFAKANNLAISQIDDSDYLLLLNPDAFAEPDWLEKLLLAAQQNPEMHFFASKMIIDQDRERYDGAGDLYHISGLVKRRYHGRLLKNTEDIATEVFTPCAGAAMYRSSSFKAIGGFDESFFCYMEDVDLGFRMQLMGFKGLYVNDAIVYHIGSAISGKQSDFSIYYGHRNLVWTYVKNMPMSLLLLTLPVHLLLNVVTIIFFSLRGKGRVIVKAKKDALLGLPKVWASRAQVQQQKVVSNARIWSLMDKSLSSFLVCHTDFGEQLFCSGKLLKRGQNFIKLQLKNNALAPLFYRSYAIVQCSLLHFKQMFASVQNIKHINQMSARRQTLLFSQQHINSQRQRVNIAQRSLLQWPEIDLTVVTFNSAQWVAAFSQSLLAQQYPLNKIHLYFVDHHSSDQTVSLLEAFIQQQQSFFASLQLDICDNKGFGSGHDFAIRQGQSAYLLVANIDLQFSDDALLQAVSMAQSDDEQVAGWEFRQTPFEHPKYYDPVTLETAWCTHACILLRRSAYEEVGGYEQRIFMYGEDVELSYRLRYAGYQLKYVPYAQVKHSSYQQAGEVKPLQFRGSALANAYIRLAYGNGYDQSLIAFLQGLKLLKGGGYPHSRRDLLRGFKKIIQNFTYFRAKNKPQAHVYFPFRYFDYELRRDGAFYELPVNDSADLPRVSIITRTYQGRNKWLKECISSVMNQTYAHIEHIVVEDGGDSMQTLVDEIHQRYSNSFYRLNYYPLEKIGRSRAGNRGLEMATGQWLMFLDDDDLIMPDHVQVLLAELLADSQLDASYSLAWDVQTQVCGQHDDKQPFYRERFYETSARYYQPFSRAQLLEQNYIPIQAILFKRELFTQYGGFDEQIEYLEDWLLWSKFALQHQFKFVAKTTSLFRTPYSIDEQVRRKLQFDSVYHQVIAKQQALQQEQS